MSRRYARTTLLFLAGLILASGVPALGNVTVTVDDDIDFASVQVVASSPHTSVPRVPYTDMAPPQYPPAIATYPQYQRDVPVVSTISLLRASIITRSRDPPRRDITTLL